MVEKNAKKITKKKTMKAVNPVKKTVKKKKKKGFTLIELLAVIVILGLLIAIAVPSVTRYIIQSRRKTVILSIDGYISSTLNSVYDKDYQFTTPNTIYAIPIECISIEKGGTNPFGEWMQANDNYWAYVLVQYDKSNFSYTYGFTFKDSAGYGMYPTAQSEINLKSSTQVKQGLELSKPKSGSYTNIASKENWSGFDINDDTKVLVLEAAGEDDKGDAKSTCTLCQKGNNYKQVEKEKSMRLSNLIKKHNTLILSTPTLTATSENSGDPSGLYSSTDTNDGSATYYFRGNVLNNYVRFANLEWKIIRINEDGTVRLILNDRIDSTTYNSLDNKQSYYSNSDVVKVTVDSWYEQKIKSKDYGSYVATTMFCEQAKVSRSLDSKIGNVTLVDYTNYVPNFKCSTDSNGKGILNSKIGLITYDELVYAGGYVGFDESNINYYIYNNISGTWTMTPDDTTYAWVVAKNGYISHSWLTEALFSIRPVISLNADVLATGTGTKYDPYEVIIK